MRAATLFSGIGAPEVSAPWADWRWSADIDDFANAVRAHHWPGVPNLGDVAAIRDPEPVDLIVFGSPCQSFSVAGKRLGLDDPRGNLALVALALVARIRPRWFVFENVPGIRSSFSGAEQAAREVQEGHEGGEGGSDEDRDFAAFLAAVRECGYLGCWRSYDAEFAGLAQRRERLFFVGYLGDWRPSAAVLFEPESLHWHPAPRREARKDTTGCTPLGFGGGRQSGPSDVATALTAHGRRQDWEVETFIAHTLRAEGFDASEDGTGRGTPIVAYALGSHAGAADGEQTNASHAGGGPVGLGIQEECAYSLRSGRTQAVAFQEAQTGCREYDTAGTLRADGPGHDPVGTRVRDGAVVRRLTPTECERLQGFPDGFTDIPWRGGKAPDGRRYKALGNSMAVPVVGWVLDRIRQFEEAA